MILTFFIFNKKYNIKQYIEYSKIKINNLKKNEGEHNSLFNYTRIYKH